MSFISLSGADKDMTLDELEEILEKPAPAMIDQGTREALGDRSRLGTAESGRPRATTRR
jgi:hypothetical protein